MAAFTVWKFDGPNGAQQAAETLKQCQREGMVKIIDHAVVSWPEGASKPITHEGHEERWHSSGWGALWGVLIGALFFVPIIGGVVGACDRRAEQADRRRRHQQEAARDDPHPADPGHLRPVRRHRGG